MLKADNIRKKARGTISRQHVMLTVHKHNSEKFHLCIEQWQSEHTISDVVITVAYDGMQLLLYILNCLKLETSDDTVSTYPNCNASKIISTVLGRSIKTLFTVMSTNRFISQTFLYLYCSFNFYHLMRPYASLCVFVW